MSDTPRTDELKRGIWRLMQSQEREEAYAWRDAIHCGIEQLERDLASLREQLAIETSNGEYWAKAYAKWVKTDKAARRLIEVNEQLASLKAPVEVAGVIALCRRSLDRDVSTLTSEQALASQCLSALESLAAQLADALEETARLKERVALDDTEREYRRQSLANEIRETLKVRGHFAAERPSDLIGCVARAIESERDRANLAEAELAKLRQHAEAMAEHWEKDDTMNMMQSAVDAYRRDYPEGTK